MIYNKDGSVEYEREAQDRAAAMPIGIKTTTEDDYQMRQVRQLALQHAVATHGATADDDQVVAAAKAYLAFLTRAEPEPAEVAVDHAGQWGDAAKDTRWPVPASTFTPPLKGTT